MSDKNKKIAAQQAQRAREEAKKDSKRSLILVWVCTAITAFLVFGRELFTGVKPSVAHYIVFGVMAAAALFVTEGYIRRERQSRG